MAKLEEYHTFFDIDNVELKAWNRCAVAFNIRADEGAEMCEEYLNQFSVDERNMVALMAQRVMKDGYEETKRNIIRGYNAIRPHFADVENG